VLELTPGAGDDRFHALAQQLTTWHALLIVDTCEHLLDSCARLADTLLSHCPGVRLLMTSREPLHASGEATFRVPSLELPPLPEPGAEPTVEELARCASVQLFVDRARHVRADFVLDEDNCAAVAALCRGLDGVPLAIELAAARVAMLTPYEILLRLGDALALLAGGTRRVTRHATLRAALTWSYELLDPSEQALLRRLSAFSGGVDLPSAEAVCGEPPLAHEVLDVVARLVSKSLLLAVPGPGGTRYRMLDTVRQLGAEKLAESDEAEALRARHCAHYLALARRHDPEHGRELGAEGVAILEREHDNLRAALRWAIDAEPTAAVALCASLWRFWFLRCHVVEGAEWVERALAAPLPPSRSRAEALLGLTGLDARRGRSQRIRFHAADAVAVMEQLDDPAATMLYRLVQATLEWATHDVAEAERIAAEVDRVSEGLGRTDMRAGASWIRAHCALTREDADVADRLLEDCMAQLDEVDPDAAPFITVVTPCVVLIPVADLMVPSYEESLLVGRRVGARHAVAHLWSARGYAARLRGDYGAARAAVSRSLHQFERLRDPLGRAQALNHLGCILRDDRVFDDAEDCLQEAEGIRHRIGDRRGEWITRANAGMSRVRRGDVATGESWTRACLAAFEAVEDMPSVANMKGALGTIALASGDSTRARTLYARAVTDLVHQSWPRVEAWYRVMVAELAVAEGLGAEADSQLDEASTLLRLQRSQAAQARVTRARDRLAAR
jgi:predicted ATPase